MTNEDLNGEPKAKKHPLANDANGNPIVLPEEAVAWRVRKMASRAGRPKTIFDPETGRQLEIRIEATIDELAEHVNEAGRYRLEAVDAHGHHLPGYIAFTEVLIVDDEEQPEEANPNAWSAMLTMVKQLVDTTSRVMEAMASAFGQVRPQRSTMPMHFEAPSSVSAPPPDGGLSSLGNIADVIKTVLSAVPSQPAAPAAQEK